MWRLPWTASSVPHAVLDVNRGCNVVCRSCYNTAPPSMKTVQQVDEELSLLLSARRLHSVSIAGGEPTLHPDLHEIVRLVRRRGLHVELFTNGVLVDENMARALAAAGVDTLVFHIEAGQRRPDLRKADRPDVIRLLEDKARLATTFDMQAGMSVTVDAASLDGLRGLADAFLRSPYLTFCLLTLHLDARQVSWVSGDIRSSVYGRHEDRAGTDVAAVELADVRAALEDTMGLVPFGYLGSNLDPDDPRWLTYVVATAWPRRGDAVWTSLGVSLLEPFFVAAHRRITGVYPFHQSTSPAKAVGHVLLNALAGGRAAAGLRLLTSALLGRSHVDLKRILVQRPAQIASDGRVHHCANCPDATIRDGHLVPLCLSDRVVSRQVASVEDSEVRCASS